MVRQPKTATQETCQGCGSTMLHLVRCDGPHLGRYDCLKCGRIGPWIKSHWTAERARSFVLPFGKHKGRSVGDLAASPVGRDYLRWVAENVSENAGIAAAIALGLRPVEDMEVTS
jgi:uncharacterized protein (DUF3820 family)